MVLRCSWMMAQPTFPPVSQFRSETDAMCCCMLASCEGPKCIWTKTPLSSFLVTMGPESCQRQKRGGQSYLPRFPPGFGPAHRQCVMLPPAGHKRQARHEIVQNSQLHKIWLPLNDPLGRQKDTHSWAERPASCEQETRRLVSPDSQFITTI